MAEKIISPGVFTNEIDQTFLPAAVADIGAALIGPTLKGPAGVPTIVTSFSDFQAKFGDVTKNGLNGESVQYLTSHAAEEYLKNSNTLTVVRILDGTFGPATASVLTSDSTTTTGTLFGTGSLAITTNIANTAIFVSSSTISQTTFVGQDGGSVNVDASDDTIRFFDRGSDVDDFIDNFATEFNAVSKFSTFTATRSGSGAGLANLVISSSAAGTQGNGLMISSGSGTTIVSSVETSGGTNTAGTETTSFTLETLADGAIMNNASTTVKTNNIMESGSKHNVRFEITNKNNKKGTFTLLVRAGNDNIKRKQTLETFTGVNLDPNSNNFISKVIGDQVQTIRTDENSNPFLQLTGSYVNKSRFVRVKSVEKLTSDYLDENGDVRVSAVSESHMPGNGSGSKQGGFGGGSNGVSGFDALGNQVGSAASSVYTEKPRWVWY